MYVVMFSSQYLGRICRMYRTYVVVVPTVRCVVGTFILSLQRHGRKKVVMGGGLCV